MIYVKAISLNVSSKTYAEFKELAHKRDLPVSELIRNAMDAYLAGRRSSVSLRDIPKHRAGKVLKPGWERKDVLGEMIS